MPPLDKNALAAVGAALGAFGVRGEIRVRPFTAEPGGVCAYGPLFDARGALVFTPKSFRLIKEGVAVTAKESLTREQAEALKGVLLHVPRSAFPPPDDPDEIYIHDLIGLRAQDPAGAPLGVVAAVHDFGAGDILEIRGAGTALFVPFTKAAAPLIDLAAGRIVCIPPIAEETPP